MVLYTPIIICENNLISEYDLKGKLVMRKNNVIYLMCQTLSLKTILSILKVMINTKLNIIIKN